MGEQSSDAGARDSDGSESKNTRIGLFLLCAVPFLVLLATLVTLWSRWVRTDWAFICENTGSRYGYIQWRSGKQTGNWYKASPLEKFMKEKHPEKLQHRWTSYAGTGKDIFGKSLSWGHGFPGPIKYLDMRIMETYFAKISGTEKLQLYEEFASGDLEKAKLAVDTILEAPVSAVTNSTKNAFE
jgi:hypothetical protein